eukprot:TRINITY_DN6281_c0_g1_i1.p1 TRINITY_DN6281_c0_g1~~TRINITY_DN6281_c0_g1_i1.p1  ORF type:complete len:601 (+),score=71.13 TRINITY_DN6281_c0_g1_i1:1139-2941(+)
MNNFQSRALTGHGSSITYLELLSEYIVTGCPDGVIIVWTRSGEKLSTILQQGDLISMFVVFPSQFLGTYNLEQMPQELSLQKDTPCLLTVPSFQSCCIWSIPNGRVVKTLNAPLYQASVASFDLASCCMPYLFIASETKIQYFLVDSDKAGGILEGHRAPVKALSSKRFYRNEVNTCVLLTSVDAVGTIKVWDVELRYCLFTVPHKYSWGGLHYPLEEHSLFPISCDFDPTAVLVCGGKFYHSVTVMQSREIAKKRSFLQAYFGESAPFYHNTISLFRLVCSAFYFAFILLLQWRLDGNTGLSTLQILLAFWISSIMLATDWILPLSNEELMPQYMGCFGLLKSIWDSNKLLDATSLFVQFGVFPLLLCLKIEDIYVGHVPWSLLFIPSHASITYAITMYLIRTKTTSELLEKSPLYGLHHLEYKIFVGHVFLLLMALQIQFVLVSCRLDGLLAVDGLLLLSPLVIFHTSALCCMFIYVMIVCTELWGLHHRNYVSFFRRWQLITGSYSSEVLYVNAFMSSLSFIAAMCTATSVFLLAENLNGAGQRISYGWILSPFYVHGACWALWELRVFLRDLSKRFSIGCMRDLSIQRFTAENDFA